MWKSRVVQGIDSESAINEIRLIGSEVSGLAQRGVVEYYHILSPCVDSYLLGYAVCDKLDVVFKELGFVLVGWVETALNEDEDAVLAAHFNVVKHIAFHAVHIEEEMPLALASNFNRGDVDSLLALVIDEKLLGGSALTCYHCVKSHRVGREGEDIATASRELVIYTT